MIKSFFTLKLFKVVDCFVSIKITNQHIISWEHCMAATKMQQKIDICILVTMHMNLIPRFKKFKSIINVNISFLQIKFPALGIFKTAFLTNKMILQFYLLFHAGKLIFHHFRAQFNFFQRTMEFIEEQIFGNRKSQIISEKVHQCSILRFFLHFIFSKDKVVWVLFY